jgi:hypothetical protein
MYTFFFRSAPYPLFTTFDAPDFQSVCTRRPRSNTPLQSLTMANDTAFLEMAQALARRLAREVPGDADQQREARIDRVFLLALSRRPTATERDVLRTYYQGQRAHFAEHPDLADKLAPGAPTGDVPVAEAAALVSLARVVLNTDNFITRE